MLLKCFIACTSCPPNTTYQKYFPTTHLENNLSLPCCAQDVLLQNTLKKYLVLVNKVIKNSIFKTKIKTRLPIKFSSTCNFRKKRVCGKNVSQSKYWNALYQETHVIYINSNTIKKKKEKNLRASTSPFTFIFSKCGILYYILTELQVYSQYFKEILLLISSYQSSVFFNSDCRSIY